MLYTCVCKGGIKWVVCSLARPAPYFSCYLVAGGGNSGIYIKYGTVFFTSWIFTYRSGFWKNTTTEARDSRGIKVYIKLVLLMVSQRTLYADFNMTVIFRSLLFNALFV